MSVSASVAPPRRPQASSPIPPRRPPASTPPVPRPSPLQRAADTGAPRTGGASPQDRIDSSFSALRENEPLSPAFTQMLSGLQENLGGNPIHQAAEDWVGREFKPNETARCADFVSTVIGESGVQPDNFRHTVRARDFARMGREVPQDQMQPGDVIGFNNTWRHSPDDKHHTHVGIYAGDGHFIHRPTFDGPVVRDSIEEYLNRERSAEDQRRNLPPRSIGGVYRMTD